MTQLDTIQRFLIDNSPVRGEIVHLQASYQKVLENHNYPEAIQKQLGEMLTAIALLTATVKIEGVLSLQARGNGNCSLLVAESNSNGDLRGVARWEGDVSGAENLQQLMGDGQLIITIEPKDGKRYQGIVSLEGQTLAHCLEQYFEQSEQLPTRIWLATDSQNTAGFMLQALPSDRTEADQDAWDRSIMLADTLSNEELLTLDNEALLHRLYHQEAVRLFDLKTLQFKCTCSVERVKNALISVGKEGLNEAIAEHGKIESQCQFCNSVYEFSAADIEQLFDDPQAPPPVVH
ncbi:molecular chaperone Hsp33 [Oceanospirillum multiglobuliferum]|uniref:33 kDa chaperonin n=1 Tax=Oceanospirillum multiglobuliferum TaxID=64969 RepID=A0A1T4M5W8_9GAMM|nr:Hsp33 family molecular chaperone HslO [Oceanospirillum multiglobuliferum]OPX56236.1 Hsp33 family molecular chaperone [Oceanospirillum multiglobuliferum]SJZ62301.1 molecular chaperone Hsp33 [Oceanospirillum multiglobuliferum]